MYSDDVQLYTQMNNNIKLIKHVDSVYQSLNDDTFKGKLRKSSKV